MGHYVNAPLVIARQENGTDLYLYQGAPVPSSVPAKEVKRLEADNLVTSDEAEAVSAGGAPAKSANKDEWVAYAQSKGDADAESKTKEQLVADHGDS